MLWYIKHFVKSTMFGAGEGLNDNSGFSTMLHTLHSHSSLVVLRLAS
jgi:hypothetical protein